jgi:hypothetical protein
MPGPGYHVHATFWDANCDPLGGVCEDHNYVAGSDGKADIPIGRCPYGPSAWWDRVKIEMYYKNGAAFIARAGSDDLDDIDLIEPVLDLQPSSQPSDRLTTFQPSYDRWRNRLLVILDSVRTFYRLKYDFVPGPIRVFSGPRSAFLRFRSRDKLLPRFTYRLPVQQHCWTNSHVGARICSSNSRIRLWIESSRYLRRAHRVRHLIL